MMMGKWLRGFKDEKGQAMVEMAIALPILLTLFCGIIDFGYIFGNQMIITNAAREGARYGSIFSSALDFETKVSNRIKDVLPESAKSNVDITLDLTNDQIPRDGSVDVSVSYTFKFLTPLTPVLLGKQEYTVKARTIMKCE